MVFETTTRYGNRAEPPTTDIDCLAVTPLQNENFICYRLHILCWQCLDLTTGEIDVNRFTHFATSTGAPMVAQFPIPARLSFRQPPVDHGASAGYRLPRHLNVFGQEGRLFKNNNPYWCGNADTQVTALGTLQPNNLLKRVTAKGKPENARVDVF